MYFSISNIATKIMHVPTYKLKKEYSGGKYFIHKDYLMFFFCSFLLNASFLNSSIKYLAMLIPIGVCLGSSIRIGKVEVFVILFGLFPPLYSIFVFVGHPSPSTYFFKYATIYFLIYFGVVALYRISANQNSATQGYFFGLIFTYFWICVFSEKVSLTVFGISFAEHTIAFAFSVFAFFFFIKNKYFLMFLAILFCFMAGKRMALGGFFVAVLFSCLTPRLKRRYMLVFLTFLVIVIVDILYSYSVNNVSFFIEKMKEVNDQGRLFLYGFLSEVNYFGNGFGSAVNILNLELGEEYNVHSDSIQSIYDLGYIGHALWYFVSFLMVCTFCNRLSEDTFRYFLGGIVLLGVFGITDNVHMYVNVLVPLFLLLLFDAKKNYAKKFSIKSVGV